MKILYYIFKIAYAPIMVITLTFGCATSKKEEIHSADELFQKAKQELDKKKYDEAEKYFDLLKLHFPASQYADDAQYYLGIINFEKSNYIMASFHFSALRKWYPNSEYCKEALFKTAMCYYNLSPPFDREQEYTFKAIEYFMEFQNTYPDDSLAIIANTYLKELRNKLAYRYYFTAYLYHKWQSYRSSIIYIDIVLDEFPETDFAEDALWLKIQIFNERGLYSDLEELLIEYKKKYPKGKYLVQIETLPDFHKSKQ